MSITITATILINDFEVLKETVEELGYALYEEETEIAMYETVEYGYPVLIPGWRYPVVITKTGEVKYDNNNGQWGDTQHLNELLQTYTEKKVLKEITKFAENKGMEIIRKDGIIILKKNDEVIEIEIKKQNINIDAKGFTGSRCEETVKNLNLPIEIQSENKKPEYFQNSFINYESNQKKNEIWIL